MSVKEAVFPFIKFRGVDIVLGPEMRSTGEVMGISERFSMAFAKSQLAAGTVLPNEGNIFISVANRHKSRPLSSRSSWWNSAFRFWPRAARPMRSKRPTSSADVSRKFKKAIRTCSICSPTRRSRWC